MVFRSPASLLRFVWKLSQVKKMKFWSQQAVLENTLFNRRIPNDFSPVACPRATLPLKPTRSVHFPNDVVFQDHVRQGDLEQIGRFLRAGKVKVNAVCLSGMPALHEAVLSGNLDCVKLLVKYGADVNQQDDDGWTPLHIACSDGYPRIARYLLSQGASGLLENECGEKPADLIDPECKQLVRLFEVGCD